MQSELKPCPFCGGAPHLMHCGAGTYMIQCLQCKATTDDGGVERISGNWNRRSPETDEDRTYRTLETVAYPDNGSTCEVLSAVLACASAWTPEARIIGNVRAGDISRALTAALSDQERAVEVGPAPCAHLDRISQLEAELGEAVRWRDIYLRERNEDRATFIRRAGELWQPLYDHAIAARSALVDVPAVESEPVAIYHGSGLIDCGDAGHHNIELVKLIPAGTKLYAHPPLREGEDSAEVGQTVGSHEITDFLYKHGDLTYSAAARAVQLLTGNGYGFTSSSHTRRESLLTMRKALNKIAGMIDAEDADLDDAIGIATAALAATRSASATSPKGCDE